MEEALIKLTSRVDFLQEQNKEILNLLGSVIKTLVDENKFITEQLIEIQTKVNGIDAIDQKIDDLKAGSTKTISSIDDSLTSILEEIKKIQHNSGYVDMFKNEEFLKQKPN